MKKVILCLSLVLTVILLPIAEKNTYTIPFNSTLHTETAEKLLDSSSKGNYVQPRCIMPHVVE